MLLNLHTHLEGRVRPSTAQELGARLGLAEPEGGWAQAMQLGGPSNLTCFLQKVSSTYPFFADRESLTRIAREAVEDAAADGEDYLELRFGPMSHVGNGMDPDEVIAAVCEGMREGSQITGMPAGAVVCALRLHGPEINEAAARAAARFAGRGVVGFDLAGDEILYPDLGMLTSAFGIARAAGLGLTCHAAEAGPASAAIDAVDLLGVTRIGHGTHIADDPAVLREIAARGIVVEICPTSNWYTGGIAAIGAHPARHLHCSGVPLVLGDDNPRQTGSPLSAERQLLRETLGFDAASLLALDRTSVAAGFMEQSVRDGLARRLDAEARAASDGRG
ncbi:adenosine deaminase [Sphingomonas oleivorans]|uniref:adenosine deaminase n=1 Tax=Sphingomonas oleivorans TaxID=1735121 RepID=A0A2T5FZI0_9SPHN|nr:adenosine deaminase [Sphingomonas oleivorans]PTQ12085.1 adenosine deaminase [Sphingomonas oleivorans]